MTDARNEQAELYELANAQFEIGLTSERLARLEELVLKSAELRRRYIAYMQLHGLARWLGRRGAWPALSDAATLSTASPAAGSFAGDYGPEAAPAVVAPRSSPFLIFGESHAPVAGAYLSYAFAAFVFATGLLAAWAWRAPDHPSTIAKTETRAESQPAGEHGQDGRGPAVSEEPPKTVRLGTRQINCQWLHPATAQADMRHGKFELAGGMLEITYRPSETKVVLFGPATYFVDSEHGGSLAAGKLLVYFVQTPDANPILDHPLFRVRTPTATVIDGGRSDFELVVNKVPASHVLVFNGSAEVQLAGLSLTRRLQAGDSLLVERAPNHGLVVFVNPDTNPPKPLFAQGRPKYPRVARGEQKETTIEIEKPRHVPFPDS
jgi:hypothetical protein